MKKEKKKIVRKGVPQGRHALTTLQKIRKEQGEVIDVNESGLKLPWITFIDEYIANGGNGKKAYLKAYPHITNAETATVEASKLLRNVNVKEELRNKLDVQRCTDEWIKNKLMVLVELHYSGKGAIVSEKALETLAKIKGMLIDTKNIAFTGQNPAQFLSAYSKEEKEKMDEDSKKLSRIVE